MAELGLNGNHEEQIVDFLKFSRANRSQCLKDVEAAFSDLAESRLLEDTFTSDEVKEMLDGLCAMLKDDVESELFHNCRTSALMLRQLFQQAEQWHLKLKVDVSELQSGELLAKIADFEQKELSTGAAAFKRRHLEPINTTGGEKLLQMEIDRVKGENTKLQSRIHELEQKATSALSARDRLQEDLQVQKSSSSHSTGQEVDTSHLQQQVAELKLQLKEATGNNPSIKPDSSEAALKKELETTSHKLLKVMVELEEAKKDLQRKFSETTQYNNMRKMMETKTTTIQELRAQLKQLQEKET